MILLSWTITQGTLLGYIDLCDCCSTVTPVFLLAEGPGGRTGDRLRSLRMQWVEIDRFCYLEKFSESVKVCTASGT